MTLVLQAPARALIRVKYGWGWLSVQAQLQVLDGITNKKLKIGLGSLFFARAEILVDQEAYISYSV